MGNTLFIVWRENAETVIFLCGAGMEQHGTAFAQFLGAAALGFALALLTLWRIRAVAALLHALYARAFQWTIWDES